MRLFGFGKKKEKETVKKVLTPSSPLKKPVRKLSVPRADGEKGRQPMPAVSYRRSGEEGSRRIAAHCLRKPRITEKATFLKGKANVHAFEVGDGCTARDIAAAVEELYGVKPRRVHILPIPKKETRMRRGRHGVSGGGRKAYVYLSGGDTIELV